MCSGSGLRPLLAGLLGLLAAALGAAEAAAPVARASGGAPPPGQSEATDSPRERDRVLQKRNPIASEYQSADIPGRAPGAQADGEGADFRAYLPLAGDLLAQPAETRLGAFVLLQSDVGRAEPGFEAVVRRRGGPAARAWSLEARANLTAAARLIEDYDAVWAPAGAGAASDYFLQRPSLGRETLSTRTRTGLLHAEHRLGAADTVFAQASWSDYLDDSVINQVDFDTATGVPRPGVPPAAPVRGTLAEGAYTGVVARRYFRLAQTRRDIARFQAGGRHEAGDWSVRYAVYHARWNSVLDAEGWNFRDGGLDFAYRVDGRDPWFPALIVAPGFAFAANAAGSFLADYRDVIVTTRDRDWAYRLDGQRRQALAGGNLWLSSGGLHRRKERRNVFDGQVYYPYAGQSLPLTGIAATADPGRVVHERYPLLPPGLVGAAARERAGAAQLERSTARTVIESEQENYFSAEAVTGAYAYASWRRGPGMVEAGLRGEHTRTETRGTVIVPAAADAGDGGLRGEVVENGELLRVREVPGGRSYTSWLPSLGAEWRLAPAWTLRAAGFAQLMRPQYFDVVDYRRTSVTTYKIREGNPDLDPVTIRTAALALDHRSAAAGRVSVALYATDIRAFFYNAQFFETIGGTLYTVSRIENGDRGSIRGVQGQWTRRFAAGGGELAPAVAYTYSRSAATLPTRPGDRLVLPERARHLLRAEAGWTRGRVGGTVGIAYQSAALDQVGPTLDRDIHREPVQSVDAALWWRLARKWRATVAAQNLTDAPERSYEGDRLRVLRNQYRATTWRLGVETRY
ncbi:MAG: TonB-dependent receptor [Opitutaceae bacterium]|nr:TonB-dependent receptor [Opitutaceae bacterium]